MNIKNLLKDIRVILLIVVVLASIFFIAPSQPGQATDLNFGLELDGGTIIQLDPTGSVAETNSPININETELTEELGVPVRIYQRSVEARGNVSQSELESVLEQNGIQVDSTYSGVTQNTLTQLRNSIQTRLEQTLGAGAGATVSIQSNLITGENYIVVEVPGRQDEDIERIIRTQGRFEIRVVENQNTTSHVIYGEEIIKGQVSQPLQSSNNQGPQGSETYEVSFELTENGIQKFRNTTIQSGAVENPNDHPLIMIFNDREVFSGPLHPDLAQSIQQNTWQGGGLSVTGLNRSQGEIVSVSLRSGALPTPVDVASSTTISPRQGEEFKTYSLIIGILAVIAVGIIIFARYRDLKIAVPTIITGLAEVIALLGFTAVFNFNIDLSHIAGLIAVVGTGVDDLVIIADGVLEEGKVKSSNIYRKRIKKAFIIIVMAAVTTIGAMLPLAYLGLGRISGFAIVTIVGVLIGIIITRPAYGSILRELLTD